MKLTYQTFLVTPLILALACLFGVMGYIIGAALGMPMRMDMPLGVRIGGGIVVAGGCMFAGWLFKYRSPADILVSTYVTMLKAFTRTLTEGTFARNEPLVVKGPHCHVRHPIYFAVVVLLVGWWMALGYTFLLFMGLIYCVWFNLVVITFEEIELRHIFGEEYERYAKGVPRFIPTITKKWKSGR